MLGQRDTGQGIAGMQRSEYDNRHLDLESGGVYGYRICETVIEDISGWWLLTTYMTYCYEGAMKTLFPLL